MYRKIPRFLKASQFIAQKFLKISVRKAHTAWFTPFYKCLSILFILIFSILLTSNVTAEQRVKFYFEINSFDSLQLHILSTIRQRCKLMQSTSILLLILPKFNSHLKKQSTNECRTIIRTRLEDIYNNFCPLNE